MTDQRNLLLAIVLSIAILLGFQFLYEGPKVQQRQAEQARQTEQTVNVPAPTAQAPEAPKDRPQLLAEQFAAGTRVKIATPSLHGSVNLQGGRIDDLTLANYHVTPDPKSPEIVLLSPAGAPNGYYAEFGWVPEDRSVPTPDANTRWTAQGTELTPDKPLVLTWDNGKGLVFERTVAVDPDYMFTITQRVRNTGSAPVRLLPYSLVSRHGTPFTEGFYILHEGPLGVFDGKLYETKYDDLKSAKTVTKQTTGGWIGITDKYWLVSLIPDAKATETGRFVHTTAGNQDRYQVDLMGTAVEIPAGGTAEDTARLFAGAKQVRLLDAYSKQYDIANFDLAIDFGWFYFLTKPFFYALDWIAGLVGNFGVAILIFTVIIKLAFFPLANKSYQA
ncbi:membrane protein insertase YidC, partial [Azospirillum sp.]|uniref:membrane protein insertase YidC n=1 Tax=Azospirillum sp. TaxID=34012 RepID=UPI002D6A255D